MKFDIDNVMGVLVYDLYHTNAIEGFENTSLASEQGINSGGSHRYRRLLLNVVAPG